MSNKKESLGIRLQKAMRLRDKKAADIVKSLNIPKSAISQYLSGKSQNMDSTRLYSLAQYLNVDEAWLMGFDVPMERKKENSPTELQPSEGEKALIELFRKIPESQQGLVLQMIRAALGSQ